MLETITASLSQLTTVGTDDLPLIACLSVLYLAYRIALTKLVIVPFGRLSRVKDINKFSHRAFDFIHYTIVSIVGVTALSQRPYGMCVFYAKNCRDVFRQSSSGFEISVLEKVYYCEMVIYYIVDILYLRTSREPFVLAMHHAASLSMAVGCVVRKSPAPSLSVMLLHDVTDVPLYFAKLMHYLDLELPKVVGLAVFFLGYTWLRMVNILFILYNSVLIVMGGDVEGPKLYATMIGLLCLLYCMHIVWYSKILKIVARTLKGKGARDERSND